MKVIYDYGTSRVIDNGNDPRVAANNIIVQSKFGDEWRDMEGYNSLSNDYAYSSAREAAEFRSKQR